jgi:hypothetical protein
MLEEKANRGVATPTSTVVGTASAFLAFISSGGQSTRVDQNWSKAFGKEIRLSLRRAILAIREAESKESAKNAQTKKQRFEVFSIISITISSRFRDKILSRNLLSFCLPPDRGMPNQRAISASGCDCSCKGPQKNIAVSSAPIRRRFSFIFIVMSNGDIYCVDDKILAQFLSWPARASP